MTGRKITRVLTAVETIDSDVFRMRQSKHSVGTFLV